MLNSMTKHDRNDQQRQEPLSKKPYIKPSFEREQVFETMALACGKVASTQGACHMNHKNS
jgi:hypothetical protein